MKNGPKSTGSKYTVRGGRAKKTTSFRVVDQTRLGSFVEAWVNVFIGFWINFTANMLILPLFGFTSLTIGTNFLIGMVYTVISVARSYIIRRWFNAKLRAIAESIAHRIDS